MSLASTYAAAVVTANVSAPTSFTGPAGLMTASVDENGNGKINFNGQIFTVPASALVAFATWVNATFV